MLGRSRQRESVSRPKPGTAGDDRLGLAERRLEVDLLASLDRQHSVFEDHQDTMGEIKGSLAGGIARRGQGNAVVGSSWRPWVVLGSRRGQWSS